MWVTSGLDTAPAAAAQPVLARRDTGPGGAACRMGMDGRVEDGRGCEAWSGAAHAESWGCGGRTDVWLRGMDGAAPAARDAAGAPWSGPRRQAAQAALTHACLFPAQGCVKAQGGLAKGSLADHGAGGVEAQAPPPHEGSRFAHAAAAEHAGGDACRCGCAAGLHPTLASSAEWTAATTATAATAAARPAGKELDVAELV